MRCIGIWSSGGWFTIYKRLTLTWDVLKYDDNDDSVIVVPININMRCIEILSGLYLPGCHERLTLTWDVLK